MNEKLRGVSPSLFLDVEESKALEALGGADEDTIREYEMVKFAESGILPQQVTENGDSQEPMVEAMICDGISGGANYVDKMPRFVSLVRRFPDGTEIHKRYEQMSQDVEEIHNR